MKGENMLSITPIMTNQYRCQKSNSQINFQGTVIRDANGVKKELSNFKFFLYKIFSNQSKINARVEEEKIASSIIKDMQNKILFCADKNEATEIFNKTRSIIQEHTDKILSKKEYKKLSESHKQQIKEFVDLEFLTATKFAKAANFNLQDVEKYARIWLKSIK